jgi:hypothetical protein
MSICKGIGNGIGGAIGKWGAGLGSALGLGTAVDIGVRAYTGYGLLETLSVPYIECSDGSYASAMEWYGSGLKCPKKSESIPTVPAPVNSANEALSYDDYISALGGATSTFWGVHFVVSLITPEKVLVPLTGGFFDLRLAKSDEFGNVWPTNPQEGSDGISKASPISPDFTYYWSNHSVNDGVFGPGVRRTKEQVKDFGAVLRSAPYEILGRRTTMPAVIDKAPAAAPLSKERSLFAPSPPSLPEECNMSCPCITPADIEKAVRKALGLNPFSPEKLVREMGAKMYAASGPSLIPVVPTTIVEAIAALTATIYMRAGYGRYPVLMPNSLINDDGVGDAAPTLLIENFAEWFEWFIKQQDAIQGEWPIDIAIVDGAKRQPLKFENISEALSEITGLVIQTATDADAAVSVASHAAVAATKAQTAAVIAQKNAECLIKFFGVRTGYGSIFVDSVITPMDSDSPHFNLKKFLTPSKQSIGFYIDDDPFDFQATLDRILRNSEISKSAVAMDASKEIVGDYARNQRKYDTAEAKREAEKELEKLEISLKAQNPEIKLKIRVDTPTASEIQGNNFVIKRPKTK